jgi:hypothetical protein
MSFENVMATVMRWATATEALAALGAALAVQQSAVKAHPEIVGALQAVSTAADITDLDELPPSHPFVSPPGDRFGRAPRPPTGMDVHRPRDPRRLRSRVAGRR